MIWAMRLDCCPKSTLCSPCVCLIDFPLYDTACRCEFPYCLPPPATNPHPAPSLVPPTSIPELCSTTRRPRQEQTPVARGTRFLQCEVLFLVRRRRRRLLWGINESFWAPGPLITGQVVRGGRSPERRGVTCFSRLPTRGCRCSSRPDWTRQAQKAALHVCGRHHAGQRCPWHQDEQSTRWPWSGDKSY